MRTILFLLLLLSISPAGNAQNTYKFSMREPIAAEGPVNNQSLRLLDLRANKEDVGTLEMGAFAKKENFFPAEPLTIMLPRYFLAMMADVEKGDEELLMLLYALRMEDKPSGDEVATFFFDADFFSGSGGQYTYLGTTDSMYEIGTETGDVTLPLASTAREKIAGTLARFAKTRSQLPTEKYTEQQAIEKRRADKAKHAIYRDTLNFKKGIYYTVEQFLNNAPVDTPFVVRELRRRAGSYSRVAFYPKTKEHKRAPVAPGSFFAIYDGEHWLHGDEANFADMHYRDGDFYTIKRYQGLREKQDNHTAYALGGVGLALAALERANAKEGWVFCFARFDAKRKMFIPIGRAI